MRVHPVIALVEPFLADIPNVGQDPQAVQKALCIIASFQRPNRERRIEGGGDGRGDERGVEEAFEGRHSQMVE